MKKSFKGFTLIECLIALAILGIASLTMAQIYAGVAKRNRTNYLINTSISNQMSYVERYTNSEAVSLYYGGGTSSSPDSHAVSQGGAGEPPHVYKSGTNTDFVKITRTTPKDPSDPSDTTFSHDSNASYSFPADVYVLFSRDQDNQHSANEKDLDLRYKYLTGHSNS